MFKRTTATEKIVALRKRIRGIAGGTSASKTYSILGWLIDRAETNNSSRKEIVSVVSESIPHLKRGAIRDFLSIMHEKLDHSFREKFWNKTDFIYTYPSGSIIEFFSADQPDKVRGPRRDILFLNEANNVSYDTYTNLEVRTKKIIFLDWNPVSEFWWYTDVLPFQDVDFITLTYKDNEQLDSSIVQAIELRHNNINWWKVYGEGKLGEKTGLIYPHFLPIDEVPKEARLVRYGLDFGYSNDPTAIVAIYRWNQAFIWDEMCYTTGMKNRNIADFLLNIDQALVIADSSEPKSIDEIKEYGIEILPSYKGPGSVNQGIQYVQSQKIFITKRSTNILKEQRNYMWMTDKNGKSLNTPAEGYDHAMDAGRYGMESLEVVEESRKQTPPSWYNPIKSFNRPGRVI